MSSFEVPLMPQILVSLYFEDMVHFELMWLLCIDAHSKYPYVAKLDVGKTTSKDTTEISRHIFITEGLPRTIVTDNGPQFSSAEFNQFCTMHGINHITSPPFHPASNGEAERFVQSLKRAVEKNCSGGETLKTALRLFLTTYRCMPHPMLDWKSPAEVLHGRQPRNALTLFSPDNHQQLQQSNEEVKFKALQYDRL